MGFKDLLDEKLGPMRGLVARPTRHEAAAPDPAGLWYRRAPGLEVRVRPEESQHEVEIGPADRPRDLARLTWRRARPALALTEWRRSEGAGLTPKALWSLVEQDLLTWARFEPDAPLAGRAGVLDAADDATALARRASMWPTPAIATAVHVAPMPFMPRGRDLAGAEMVGVRLASLERGHEVLGATITGGEKTGHVLRDLLPRLDGRRTAREILDAFEAGRPREAAGRMLQILDAVTALEPVRTRPPLAARFAAPARPQVTWLGHAGVLVQAAGKSILVDPLFNASSEPEDRWAWPPKLDPRLLPDIDAVFVTHGDNDHLNPSSLVMLPRHVPVYVPRTPRDPPPYQIDLFGVLRTLGFTDVRGLEPGDAVGVGGVQVSAWPFEGEDWGLDLAQLTYLFEAEGLSVFCSADAARMDDVYRALGARSRRVDLAFMGVSGAAEPMVSPPDLGYGNFYADWVPPPLRNEWVQHCSGPKEAAMSLELMRPRFAFGYACGGASYIPMAYCDRGDHGQLAELLIAAGGEVRPVSLPLGAPVAIEDLGGLPTHAARP